MPGFFIISGTLSPSYSFRAVVLQSFIYFLQITMENFVHLLW